MLWELGEPPSNLHGMHDLAMFVGCHAVRLSCREAGALRKPSRGGATAASQHGGGAVALRITAAAPVAAAPAAASTTTPPSEGSLHVKITVLFSCRARPTHPTHRMRGSNRRYLAFRAL